jgi:hypothetical protein
VDSRNVIALSFQGYFMRLHKIMQGLSAPATPVVDSVVPSPKLKLLDQIREVMRLKRGSTRMRSGRAAAGRKARWIACNVKCQLMRM